MTIRFLRLPEVIARRGKRRTSIYAEISQGLFPPGVDLGGGGRARGWPEHEVEAVNVALLGGASRGELIELVASLLAARKVACDPAIKLRRDRGATRAPGNSTSNAHGLPSNLNDSKPQEAR